MTLRHPAISFIAQQLRPYRKTVARLSGLAVLAAALDTVIPVLYGRALDTVIAQRPIAVLAAILGAWLALRLVADAFRRHIVFTGQEIARRTSIAFVRGAIERLLEVEIAAHHARKGGEVQERIGRVRDSFRQLLRNGVFDFAPNTLTVLAVALYLFAVDVRIGLANALVIAAFIWRSRGYIVRFDVAWEETNEAMKAFYGRAWDALRNILIVKSSSAEAHEHAAGKRLSARILKTEAAASILFRRHNAEHDVILGAGTVLLFAIAATGIASGRLTPGQLVTVFGFSFLTWGIVRSVTWVYWEFLSLGVYVRAYDEIARLPVESYGVGRKVSIRGAVSFANVRFRYREDTPVLEDVTFEVASGQTIAIVGESGEGKTTIVELLSRYYKPQRGTIRVDDVQLHDIELKCLRSQIAYVPQDLTLFHDTLQENIRYGRLGATDAEVEAVARRSALHGWIVGLPDGYDTVVGERGLKLSAGQRQRVAIARAFLRNPRILILDEPTSQLDAATEEEIQHSLRNLMSGRTTFVIAHRLRTVQGADRILVLKDGRIVERGTHDELMARDGEYRRLRDLQFADTAMNTA